jgi:eukaryotic-like serine/threonine-protein kinase
MAPERYGSYRVYEQLGKGGMATVHRAEQDTPQGVRQVALKRLVPSLDSRTVSLFLDEARLVRYLHHPNIPVAYDSGRVFGTYFIAMEYIPGRTLKELIAQSATTVGPVPQPIVLNLAAQLCDALDYAHTRRDEQGRPLGIIHRDVTPANLILAPSGVLKLVDFGLAKATGAKEPSVAGVIKGKLGYVAPEYTRGEIDHRADLWAVGIIMYELLTGGRQLFEGPSAVDTISRVRSLPIPRPSMANPIVHHAVDDVVMGALERDPRRRWGSAADMRDRIRAVAEEIGDTAGDRRVIEWVNWAFEQKPGRAIQLTPMMPMPVYPGPGAAAETEATGEPSAAPVRKTQRGVTLVMCVVAIVLLLLGALAWTIAR